jgi:hypothetical protein
VENSTKYWAFLLSTKPGYTGSTAKSIGDGSSKDDLTQAYRAPFLIYPARQGDHYLYTDPNLLVFVNAEDKVAGWTLYTVVGVSGN